MRVQQWITGQWSSVKPALMQAWGNFIFLLISLDQTLGMLLGFLMHPCSRELWPDETMSARCGRLGGRYPYKFWKAVIDFLFLWQGPNHCVNAYEKEKTRYHFPPEMRENGSGKQAQVLPPV